MHLKKRRFMETITAILMLCFFCISNVVVALPQNDGQADTKIMPAQFNVSVDKVWTINFSKAIDFNSINYDNVRVYEKLTGQSVYIDIIKNTKEPTSFKVKPRGMYIRGKGYCLEVKNIKSKDKKETLEHTSMDFYIKNIYAGLPGENGLVIVDNKAYAADYFKMHTKEVNEIIYNKNYDIYYSYEAGYQKLSNIFKKDDLNGSNAVRKYDEIIYVDPQGKKHLYRWDKKKEEYALVPPSIDANIVVKSDIKLVTIKISNLIAVPEGSYFKLKHSNLVKKFGETIAYTASQGWEQIDILTQDKTVIATGYLNVNRTNTDRYYLKMVDEYGSGNYPGNINNNGIAAQDSEGYIYYVNTTDKEKLYKVGFDGMYNKKISEDKVQYVNVSEDWIYYSNYTDSGKLYRSKTNGSSVQKICDDRAAYISLSGEYIYYSNHSNGGKLYRIKKDGSDGKVDPKKVKRGLPVCTNYGDAFGVTDEVAYINIVGDWIYYSNYSDGHKPYVINKEGTYRGKLSNDWTTSVQVSGDWVYYCSGRGVLSKVRKDGSGNTIPIKGQASEFNKGFHFIVFEDWIYYSNSEDKNKLYKINTDGSGEKVKLSEDSVGYINIIGTDLYYNTLNGKLNRLAVDADGTTKPEEVGKITADDKVDKVDNIKATVDYADVNQPLQWIESKYLPEKVASIMQNNTMQQLVVIWDTKKVSIKDGVYTYKGNLLGYNKTVTMELTIPSEMLNDTNEIYVNNNGDKNDTIEVAGTKDGSGVKLEAGDLVKVYSEEACINNLGKGIAGRDRKALLQKLDLDPYGKSVYLTVMRKGKAESQPTEVKQTDASIIREDAALDDDKVGIGVDARDLRITNWIPSKTNEPIKQYLYLLPSKTVLDMRVQEAVDTIQSITTNSWDGFTKYNKNTAFKRDSKKTILKAGKYDIYIAAEYAGYGTPDVDGNSPSVYGKTSCDTPAVVNFQEEKLPQRPTIKKQIVKGILTNNASVVILDKAPAEGETAWLIPIKGMNDVKGWKAEDTLTNPFDKFITSTPDGAKFEGDGSTKEMPAPKGLESNVSGYENVEYKLFIVNSVGASVESANTIIVDNKKPTLAISSITSITIGEKFEIRSNENGKVYIIKSSDSSSTVEQLENAVKAKTGKVLSVTGETTYKLDTNGLEAAERPDDENYKIVTVDEAGNISIEQMVTVYIRIDELRSLIEFAENTGIGLLDPLNPNYDKNLVKLNAAITSANNILQKVPVLQSEITRAFNSLKSILTQVGVTVTPDINLDVTPPNFSVGYPKISDITSNSAKLSIKIDEKGDVYYLVLPKLSPVPSIQEIMAGQNVNVTEAELSNPKDNTISSLAANTEYKIYLVTRDEAYNISRIKSISLKTT